MSKLSEIIEIDSVSFTRFVETEGLKSLICENLKK